LNNTDGNTRKIETTGLTYSYNTGTPRVIDNLDAAFGPSRFSIVIGPNGSGKSTLARIIIGFLKGYDGDVRIDGDSTRTLTLLETARRVAFVPQENPVSAPLTVREAVELGRFCHFAGGIHQREQDIQNIDEALELTGMKGFEDKRLDSISGGEKQRAMIARALSQDAGNLILDEPTANLDLKYQPLIFGLLRKLVDEKGYNVIAISHDVNLASRYADTVLLMKEGKVFASGSPSDVIKLDVLEEAYETKLKSVGENIFIPLGDGGAN